MSSIKQIQASYELRPYQQEIYDEIPRRLLDGGVIVQSPPRSGKSKIIDATVRRIIAAGKIPLVLSHRDKIQKQLIEHCNGVSIDAKTDHVFVEKGRCYVAMVATIANRPMIIQQLESAGNNVVILNDEMHVSDFNKIMDALPKAHRIGFSATPTWKHAKWINQYYTSLIHGPQVQELIQWGNIVPVDYYEMVSDLEGLRKQSNSEYTEASQEFVFGQAKIYDGLFTELTKFTFNKCAIFCASKKSADKLLLEIQSVGNKYWKPVVYYSGKKDYELAKFTKLGEANILITVRSLGTGWDYPPLDFVVLWCAMCSLNSFYQTVFRNRTPHPGKNRVTTLDFGGNNSRFGGSLERQAATMDRDWLALSQPPPKLPKEGQGVGAIATCPACEFMHSASSRSCPNCGYIYPDADVALRQGELVRISEEKAANDEKVVGRRLSTLDPIELAYVVRNGAIKPAHAMRVAKSRTISQPDFAQHYGEAMNYKAKWADRVKREIKEHNLKSLPFADFVVSLS